jgi:hypothetical protein
MEISKVHGRQVVSTMLIGLLLSVMTAEAASRPTLVELYTSEGCSSCPPAEKLLGELAQRPDVLPLAFHVDYWDGLGWRDRFSMQEATQRQQEAARRLKLTTVGTPQMIVDGQTAIWGANREHVAQALQTRGKEQLLTEVTRKDLVLVVRAKPPAPQNVYDVFVIGYLPRTVTSIGHGENAGRTLTEVNVVRYIRKIGASNQSTNEWRTSLEKLPQDAPRIAVILQERTTGAVLGAQSIEVQ